MAYEKKKYYCVNITNGVVYYHEYMDEDKAEKSNKWLLAFGSPNIQYVVEDALESLQQQIMGERKKDWY